MAIADDINLIQRWIGANPTGDLNDPDTVAELLKDVVGLQQYIEDKKSPVSAPTPQVDVREVDQRSQTQIHTILPAIQIEFKRLWQIAREVADAHGCTYVFISGTRTYKEQNELYEEGRSKPGSVVTNARGGYSNHNFGIAIDGGVFMNGKYLDGSSKKADKDLARQIHESVNSKVRMHGLRLDWGGNWTSFKDLPHWEYRTGLTTKQKRERIAKGQTIV